MPRHRNPLSIGRPQGSPGLLSPRESAEGAASAAGAHADGGDSHAPTSPSVFTPLRNLDNPALAFSTGSGGAYDGSDVQIMWRFVASLGQTIAAFAMALIRLVRILLGADSLLVLSRVDEAATYREWREAMVGVDAKRGYRQWASAGGETAAAQVLDQEGIAAVTGRLAALRDEAPATAAGAAAATLKQLELIRKNVVRTTFGVTHPDLYARYPTGTKTAVHEFLSRTTAVIRSAATASTTDAERLQSLKVLAEAAQLYGTTALVLNGSIALGAYHLGIIKGLVEAESLPRVIFGSNTGAIVAAVVCCSASPVEALDPKNVNFAAFQARSGGGAFRRKVSRLLSEGALMDIGVLLRFARDNLGDLTFQEAFDKTGRILNIEVRSGQTSWLLNYLSTPNVVIYTAAVAACATRGFYPKTDLLSKLPDGELIKFDIPALSFSPVDPSNTTKQHTSEQVIERVRQLFNVKMFIVSECSILRLPMLRLVHRKGFLPRLLHFFTEEFWRLFGFVCGALAPIGHGFTRSLGAAMSSRHIQPSLVIYPASSLWEIVTLLRNPDGEWLRHCEHRSEQKLWPRLEEIKAHVKTELALHEALTTIVGQREDMKEALASFTCFW